MTEKEKLEVIKHSYEVLQGLVKDLNERVKDAKDGIATSDQNLIMGSLYGLDCTAERIRNVYAVMTYLHTPIEVKYAQDTPKMPKLWPIYGRLPAIIRKNNKTEICSTCGLLEALDAYINRG